MRHVVDFVRGKTFIRCDKAMPSNLVLIPLIYMRYHYPQAWQQAKELFSASAGMTQISLEANLCHGG